jgi:hypothetical protein
MSLKERIESQDSAFYWAQAYCKRLYICLLYKAGEITLEEATEMGEHRDAKAFLKFTETQMQSGRELKVKYDTAKVQRTG